VFLPPALPPSLCIALHLSYRALSLALFLCFQVAGGGRGRRAAENTAPHDRVSLCALRAHIPTLTQLPLSLPLARSLSPCSLFSLSRAPLLSLLHTLVAGRGRGAGAQGGGSVPRGREHRGHARSLCLSLLSLSLLSLALSLSLYIYIYINVNVYVYKYRYVCTFVYLYVYIYIYIY